MFKIPHSVMFHHFHGNQHPKSQGSISAFDFEKIIEFLELNYNLIGADEFYQKTIEKKLEDYDVCLSFDDALKCQFEIAKPILKAKNIKAFFFIYSSAFSESPDPLEIFRFVRNNHFETVEVFYEKFFELLKAENFKSFEHATSTFDVKNYLKELPYLSDADKFFRYCRDVILGPQNYYKAMFEIIRIEKINIENIKNNLWMREANVRELSLNGHKIGLHSTSHPTRISNLTFEQQKLEYQNNLNHLLNITGHENIAAMSHPCGDYDRNTLEVLKQLGIRVGFRANMSLLEHKSTLEIPRESHSNIFRGLQ